ncbi:hypothetical protein HYV85_00340 [Candidatus Woesearchaeota archaeon]|nr:hypothetical protein [Candidatus Woesearchaeota archaeon]
MQNSTDIKNMEFVDDKTIKLDKVLNELDKFVLKFIKILEKHADYVIVSGYVSILFGRSRSTEDIDIFIKELSKEQFDALYQGLKEEGYWCLNGESADGIYSYLQEGLSIRFADEGETIPNFEVKFAKKKSALMAFADSLTIVMEESKVKLSSLERQIAYKRYYLKSDKDLEDAAYIEKLFKEHINYGKVEVLRRLIENEMA